MVDVWMLHLLYLFIIISPVLAAKTASKLVHLCQSSDWTSCTYFVHFDRQVAIVLCTLYCTRLFYGEITSLPTGLLQSWFVMTGLDDVFDRDWYISIK